MTLTQQPFGKALLALMALGLIAYAVYLLLQARYRRIKTSQPIKRMISKS